MAREAMAEFTVDTCDTDAEVVDAARRFGPDLIVHEVMMPGRDGPSALAELRGTPESSAKPVIFMTAKVMMEKSSA